VSTAFSPETWIVPGTWKASVTICKWMSQTVIPGGWTSHCPLEASGNVGSYFLTSFEILLEKLWGADLSLDTDGNRNRRKGGRSLEFYFFSGWYGNTLTWATPPARN
jgi:hypothetical protein